GPKRKCEMVTAHATFNADSTFGWFRNPAPRSNRQQRRTNSGLFGIVHKISLRVVIRVFSNDLYGCIVGTDRTIRSKAKEDRQKNVLFLDRKRGIEIETRSG